MPVFIQTIIKSAEILAKHPSETQLISAADPSQGDRSSQSSHSTFQGQESRGFKMSLQCKKCNKDFKSTATLNFHIKKSHGQEISDSDFTASLKTRRGPKMLKFGKIIGASDCLTGSFKIFNVDKSKVNVIHTPDVEEKSSTNQENPLDQIAEVVTEEPEPTHIPEPLRVDISLSRNRGTKRRVEEEVSSSDNSGITDTDFNKFSIAPPINSSTPKPIKSNKPLISSATDDDIQSIIGFTESATGTSSSTESRRGRPRKNSSNERICPVLSCGRTDFRNYSHYTNHLEVHEGKKPFICPECDLGYKTDLQLLEHVSLRHTKEAAFDCVNCGKHYLTRRGLRGHKC